MPPICYIVVPCYNEEAALPKSAPVFLAKIQELVKNGAISKESKILFVDDGSKDKTWQIIEALHKENSAFIGLKLAKNEGHENALYAGLVWAQDFCDFTISLDADLQDDVNAVNSFIKEYQNGAQVVFGCRKDRSKDSRLKKYPALGFYKLMQILKINIVPNHADYRLIAKEPLKALKQYKEVNLFLRAVVADLGFKKAYVYYDRIPRIAGQTKYPLFKLTSLAWQAITSFSIIPIRLISILGIIIAVLSSIVFCYFFLTKLFSDRAFPGYASLICSIWLLGGLQLFAIGIIGEYIGKTYLETKQRPRYIIEKTLE